MDINQPTGNRDLVLTFKASAEEKTDYLQSAKAVGNGELSSLIRLLLSNAPLFLPVLTAIEHAKQTKHPTE